MHLCHLFKLISVHGFVPNEFGQGYIVPILKDKTGDVNDLNNYRGITLIPIISKLMEVVLIDICENNNYLATDDLQFGFKKGLGCSNAIFVLRATIDYFKDRGSTIFAAALDVSKAFDKVNHYKLFTSLTCAGFPPWIISVLVNWYGKLFVSVRWKGEISKSISARSGVRQGSSLSPCIFNIFINKFITDLRAQGVGCCLNGTYLGCIMYADDIILLSATVNGLQIMLTCCYNSSKDNLLTFNCKKSTCMMIGPRSRFIVSDMQLGPDTIAWCTSFKYLGITFNTGPKLSVNIDVIKHKFFASCNCILGNAYAVNEIVKLSLMEAYCLPVLQYATAALRLTRSQSADLNACWNSCYRRIFGFHKYESVREFINGLGRLDFTHLRMYLTLKFFNVGFSCRNLVFHKVLQMVTETTEFSKLCHLVNTNGVDKFVQLSVGRLKASVCGLFRDSNC